MPKPFIQSIALELARMALSCPRLVDQNLCESGVIAAPIQRELVGCAVAEGGVGQVGVVVPPGVLGYDFGFQPRMEQHDGQQLAARFAVE